MSGLRTTGPPAQTPAARSTEGTGTASAESVVHPAHYGGDGVYEVLKVVWAWGLNFCTGNAVKYIARAGRKDPDKRIEDLRKAKFYLEREINRLEAGE